MAEEIDFYLSSLESTRFEPVRECTVVKWLRFSSGKDCVLVRVRPSVVGQDFNRSEDLEEFVLAARFEGKSITSIDEYPCFVFICLPNMQGPGDGVLETDDVQIVGWGELYRSGDDARRHVFG